MSSANIRALPKSYSAFSPRAIPGCAVWLDATDVNGTGSSLADGTSVSTWVDKSGNGNNFVQVGSYATPTVSTNAINSLPCLSFTGNGSQNSLSNQILTNSSFVLNSSAVGYSIFTVARQNASAPTFTGYNYMMSAYGSGAGSGLFYGTAPTTKFLITANGTAGGSFGFNDLTANTPNTLMTTTQLTSISVLSSTLTPYLNGTAMGTKTGTVVSLTGINVGDAYAPGQSYGGQTWGGVIGEILIFNGDLTSSQRQQVEGYLAQKWGLASSLPATHPYKSLPLFTRPFLPVDIDSCTLWLDAADTSTITLSGSSVTAVRDKVQNITFTTQGTSSLLTLSNAINSRQTLYFNNSGGNNVYLQGTFSNLTTGSFFVVWRAATQSSVDYRALYAWQSGVGSLRFPVFGYVNSLTTVAPYTTFVGPGTPSNTVSAGTNYLTFYSWFGGTTTNVGFNGATPTAGTQTAYPSSSSVFTIMGELGASLATCTGFIGEMIFYNAALSASQRQQVEGYLAWKWGLQGSFPSGQPFRLFRTPSILFTPPAVSGCSLWLDAADSSTFTLSGSNVTQWRDKSGNGRNATVPQSSPTYVTNALNKLPIVRFSNPTVSYNSGYSGQYFSLPVFNFGTTTTRNIFAVITPSATRSFDAGSSDEAVIAWRGFHSGMFVDKSNLSQFALHTTWWNTARNTQAVIKTNITTPPTSFLAYAGTSCTGSTATAFQSMNGTLATSNFAITALDNTYTVLSIGVAQPYSIQNGYNWYYNGDIAEIVVYEGNLTSGQRQQVEGYLAQKWGLRTSLPTNHPYYITRA